MGASDTLRCDVCIIGSGAGGAVLAAGLAARGYDVIVLEAGGHYKRADFLPLREDWSYSELYQERGTRGTADLAMTILQGESVGGSTTVNWTTCYRTPDRVLDHWQQVHGLDDLTKDVLAPHFDAVEARLSIAPWPEELVNANNAVLRRGCEALGFEYGVLRRNVRGCANSGYCGLGCPTDGKQAMGITYLQDATDAGARLIPHAQALRFEHDGQRVSAVLVARRVPHTMHSSGEPFRVEARTFVSSGGAINSPALLLRSGISAGGLVGQRTFLHPVVAVAARYPERIDGFYGAPQSIGSHQFIDRGPDKLGYFLESPPLQPMLASTAIVNFGKTQAEFLAQLPYTAAIIALSVDGFLPGDVGGRVTLHSDGRPSVDYPIGPALVESMRDAHLNLARLHLAAGATEVATGHVRQVVLRSEADLAMLGASPYGAHEHAIFTAHQMGGCTMSPGPTTGVVGQDYRVWGFDNLFVVDGSVLPTSLGVNPSETVYALAHRAVSSVADSL